MLKELRIKNFVLIEALTLTFSHGICLLTGETGAGKSVLIDAIEAALGGRVSLDLIRTGAAKATIEATFSLKQWPSELLALLEAEGIALEIPDELTLSRELSPKGARCRLEGQQVTQGVLRRAGTLLVDVLSQHEHQALMEPPFHLTLLDTYGDLIALREQVGQAHAHWHALATERKALVEGAQARQQQRDFWAYQLQEIEAAAIAEPDEEAALRAERLRLANVEQLRLASGSAYEALYAGENGPSLYDQLGRVIGALAGVGHLDAALAQAAEQLESVQYTLRDVGAELRDHSESLDADPARLDEIEERLDLLNKLGRKYGPGLAAVLAHAEQLRRQLQEVEQADGRLAALDAELVGSEAGLAALCERLTAERHAAASKLAEAVEHELRELELPDARFHVALSPHEGRARATGAEAAEFRIAMNPGEPPRPLARTASGGEMARVMLALKTVLAHLGGVPTLIFDEVDTGISGKAAQAVAEKLAELGRHYQVLCITHLPTVAAMADWHVHLEKHVEEGRTQVLAHALDAEARVRELAMLSSGNASAAALGHAAELIKRAEKIKRGLKRELAGR